MSTCFSSSPSVRHWLKAKGEFWRLLQFQMSNPSSLRKVKAASHCHISARHISDRKERALPARIFEACLPQIA